MDTQGRGPSEAPGGGGFSSAGSVEEMLVTLRKSSRDISFYPTGHPLLLRSLERAVEQVRGAIGGRFILTIAVTRGGFQVDGRPVGAENRQLVGMAEDLFLRRIQQFGFGPGVGAEELAAFLRIAVADPKALLEQGGPAKVLASQGVSRIQLSELDYRRTEQTKPPPQPEPATSEPASAPDKPEAAPAEEETPTTAALLQRLEDEAAAGGVAGYEWAASRLEAAVTTAVQGDRPAEVLAILRAFLGHRGRTGLAEPITQRAAQAVDTAASPATLEYLSDWAGRADTGAAADPSEVLVALGARVLPGLLSRMAKADRGPVRERLIGLLLAFRHTAQPELLEGFKGVDRELGYDLAAALRACPDQGGTTLLGRLLRHKAVWVRAEALRSLAAIGGETANRLILQALRDPDLSIVELAIGQLGAGKVKQATPSLLRLATQRDLKGKPFAVRKAAVAALGALGDPGCIATLQQVLFTRTWFRRSAGEELRRSAAAALVAVGRPEARAVIEAGARTRWRWDVRRACKAALPQAEPPPAPEAAAAPPDSAS
jgi:HEAT repeats